MIHDVSDRSRSRSLDPLVRTRPRARESLNTLRLQAVVRTKGSGLRPRFVRFRLLSETSFMRNYEILEKHEREEHCGQSLSRPRASCHCGHLGSDLLALLHFRVFRTTHVWFLRWARKFWTRLKCQGRRTGTTEGTENHGKKWQKESERSERR